MTSEITAEERRLEMADRDASSARYRFHAASGLKKAIEHAVNQCRSLIDEAGPMTPPTLRRPAQMILLLLDLQKIAGFELDDASRDAETKERIARELRGGAQ